MKYIFISYSHNDADFVDIIKSACEKLQIEVWIDRRSIDGGKQWKDSINNAIQNASLFIACLSHNYFKNPQSYIRDELTIAFNELTKRGDDHSWFIPVKIGNYHSSKVPKNFAKTLNEIHIIDITKGGVDGVTDLLNVILPIIKPETHWFYVLKRIIASHFESQIEHFTKAKIMRFTQIEDSWKSLLDESIVKSLSTMFFQIHEKAKLTKTHQTERLILKDKVILTTYIPYLDPEKFKSSLFTNGSDLPDRYLQFVLDNVREIRKSKDWKITDFVHLLYFDDGSEWVFDVMYLINFQLTVTIFGYFASINEQTKIKDGKVPVTYEEKYPTYLTNALEYGRFINLTREEGITIYEKDINPKNSLFHKVLKKMGWP